MRALRRAAAQMREAESSPFMLAVADWLDAEAESAEAYDYTDGPAFTVAILYLYGRVS